MFDRFWTLQFFAISNEKDLVYKIIFQIYFLYFIRVCEKINIFAWLCFLIFSHNLFNAKNISVLTNTSEMGG